MKCRCLVVTLAVCTAILASACVSTVSTAAATDDMAVSENRQGDSKEPAKEQPASSNATPPIAATPSKPAPKPFRDPFYNHDFSYLDAADYTSCDPLDALKRIGIGPCTTLDVGGEYRLRFHDEHNFARSRLQGEDNNFLLQRTRLYSDFRYGDRFRVYAEFIDATSSFERHPPRTIEENRADFINLFGEVKLYDGACESVSLRAGRGTSARQPAVRIATRLEQHPAYIRRCRLAMARQHVGCGRLLDAARPILAASIQ